MATRGPDTENSGSSEAVVASWISQLSFEEIPPDVVKTVERAFVDTVGVILAGSRTEGGAAVQRVTETGRDSVSLLGGAASPSADALAYGQAGHALDYDDVSWGMDGHPSTVLVPAILALSSESEHRTETESKIDTQIDPSGRDAIAAYVAGFETACAIAEPISPAHYQRGWHATATFGVFGAVAASAWLLDLTLEATRHALTIAASMPAGLKRNFGTMTKPLHAGLAARSGVTAAQLAQQGFTADNKAISGDRGFWDLYGDSGEDDVQIGEEWYIQNAGIHVKMYPCCYFMHTSIAATQELGRDHDIQPDEVERIRVIASQGAADALHHENPQTGLEAKFSMQYAVASALVRDSVGLTTFEDAAVGDSDVDTVRKRVAFDVDPTLAYDSHEATVRIETDRGIFDITRYDPPGTHDHPPTESELRRKFFECAQPSLSPDVAADVHASLVSLRDVKSLADVLSVQ